MTRTLKSDYVGSIPYLSLEREVIWKGYFNFILKPLVVGASPTRRSSCAGSSNSRAEDVFGHKTLCAFPVFLSFLSRVAQLVE